MKVTDASTYRILQTNLERNATKMQDLFFQGSTGLKLNKASDDPSAIQPVLTARNQITLSERFLNTLGISSDKMAATDTSLATIENIFQRAKEISVNAINSSLNQQDLDTLATEVSELKKQMLDTANAQIDGKYIFAGYSVTDAPFIENPDYDPELYDQADNSTWPVLYIGDENRTTLEIGEGEYLDVNLTGNELFLGIENSEWAAGATGLTGSTISSSGPLTPGGTGDITIQNENTTFTIPESFLTDTGDNYADKLSNLLENGPSNLSDLSSLSNYNMADGDTYSLTIDSNSTPITVTLDGSAGQEFTLAGMASALGNQLLPPNAAATSGTLPNGVSFDTTTGELLLTHSDPGTNFTLNETIVDGNPANGAPLTGIDSQFADSLINATIHPATTDLGDFSQLASYDPLASDQYQLDITSEGSTVGITLDGSAGQELTLAGLTTVLGNSLVPPDPTATAGTLPNGVSYDLSTGRLVLTGNDNGADIDLAETVTDGDLLDGPAPSPVIGGNITAYGTVDVSADTTDNTAISGAGLTNAGLSAGTLSGSVTVDIFGVLTRLEESLRAGNIDDPDGVGGGVQEGLEMLDLAADQNRRKRSQLGVKAGRIDNAIDGLEGSLIDTKMTLSRYQDADITETYNAIIQQQAAWEAALSVTGKVSEVSILDYL